MNQETDFQELLAASRNGDAAAMSALIDRYEPALRTVARVQLGEPLRPFLDSTDLVQSVHRSLMLGLKDSRFDVERPEQLISLALTMVRRKIARHWRKMRRQKSAVVSSGDNQSTINLLCDLSSSEPSPESTVAVREATQKLFAELTPYEQKLIELRLCGFSTAEAATELEVAANVARVHLHRLRKRLEAAGVLADLI